MAKKATAKQIDYAMALLDKAGYGNTLMNKSFARLGAKRRHRSGTVEDWLAGMSRRRISKLIDVLASPATKKFASEAQVSYAIDLLEQQGYSVEDMGKLLAELGVTQKNKTGEVEDWLENMSREEISKLITALKQDRSYDG